MRDFQDLLLLAQEQKVPSFTGVIRLLDVDPLSFSDVLVSISRHLKLSEEFRKTVNEETSQRPILREEERMLLEVLNWGCAAGYYYAIKKYEEILKMGPEKEG